MKKLFLQLAFGCMLISAVSNATNYGAYDLSSGTFDVSKAVVLMDWIQAGQPQRIFGNLEGKALADTATLRKESEYVAAHFPYHAGSSPSCIAQQGDTLTWHQRTFYDTKNKVPFVLFRITLFLRNSNGQLKVTEIRFEDKGKVEVPQPYYDALFKPELKLPPPPPPPPPAVSTQPPASAADIVPMPFVAFPARIHNSLTAQHVLVPGTRLSMIPPKGFKLSAASSTFILDDYTGINVMDLGESYFTNAASFSKEEFIKRGAAVFEYKEIRIDSFYGKYVYLQSDAKTQSCVMIFGDSTFSAALIATFPALYSWEIDEIQQAFKSVVYNKKQKVDPLSFASFEMDTAKSMFAFRHYASNLYLYELKDSKTKKDSSVVILLMTLPADAGTTAFGLAVSTMENLEKSGATGMQMSNEFSQTINGSEIYSCELQYQMGTKHMASYLYALKKGKSAVVFQGITEKDADKYFPEFKRLCASLHIKPGYDK